MRYTFYLKEGEEDNEKTLCIYSCESEVFPQRMVRIIGSALEHVAEVVNQVLGDYSYGE